MTDAIIAKASAAIFGKPLVTNSFRSLLVEAMVATALEPAWIWCAADYASWDFERGDGLRLEVKQSAARQPWAADGSKPSAGVFDIAPRTGFWEGPTWRAGKARNAEIYVLAHHPLFDETADHREPDQWSFHVIPAASLPETRTLSLSKARGMSEAVGLADLPDVVAVKSLGLSRL